MISLRAFIIGCFISLLISIAGPWGEFFVKGSTLCYGAILPIVIFLFFLLSCINLVLEKINQSLSLKKSELIIIYIMGTVSAVIPTGFTGTLLPLIIAPFYFANDTNKFAHFFQPYLKSYFSIKDKEAIKWFFEGLPEGIPIPWAIWIKPLLFWTFFALTFYFFLFMISKIVSKQWIEKERIIYPLNKLPLGLAGFNQELGLIENKHLLKNGFFWLAMIIPISIHSWNGLSLHFPMLPRINLYHRISLGYGIFSTPIIINFTMMGFAYFINLDLLLSLWFFYLFYLIEQTIFIRIGIEGGSSDLWASTGATAILSHQQFGALLVFAVYTLWLARKEFLSLSNRIYSRLLILNGFIILIFFRLTGLPFWFAGLIVLGIILIYTGLSKIIAQGGLTTAQTPMIPQTFLIRIFPSLLTPSIITGLSLSTIWLGETGVNMMNSMVHQEKLKSIAGINSKQVFICIIFSIFLTILGSTIFTIYLAYTKGGLNLSDWLFLKAPQWPFNYFSSFIQHHEIYLKTRSFFTFLGGIVFAIFLYLRNRFFWWPFNPIGMTIALTWPMRYQWFSIFLVWFVKKILLKYGGKKIYQKFIPFALGLACGELFIAMIWVIIDSFTGITGHVIFAW